MTNEQIIQHIAKFKEIYSNNIIPNRDHDNGRNVKIRKEATRNFEHNIWLFRSYVRHNEGLYDFLTIEDGEAFPKAIIWDEFISFQYFMRDLHEAIEKLEVRLKENNKE